MGAFCSSKNGTYKSATQRTMRLAYSLINKNFRRINTNSSYDSVFLRKHRFLSLLPKTLCTKTTTGENLFVILLSREQLYLSQTLSKVLQRQKKQQSAWA